ncbi:hypothetical protein C8R46DRAFT_1172377 [Mycena filopes]|nr:hypothetical protein C8R46DRAFT_1172377 [Mycena filopes]
MEFIPGPAVHQILCADCGAPNSANLCVVCLRNTVDITEAIPKQGVCPRALFNRCLSCHLICRTRPGRPIYLEKLKGLNKVRLTEAHFSWTKPHSSPPKVPHKGTFLSLEQLILKHKAQKDTIAVKEVKDGLDLFYSQRSYAIKMVESLSSVVPVRSKSSAQLLSSHTHTGRLDPNLHPAKAGALDKQYQPARGLRTQGNSLQLMDLTTLQSADISSAAYWRTPFDSLPFTVLDVEPDGRARGKWRSLVLSARTTPTMDVEGYHVTNANFMINSADYAALPSNRLPDIVLIKKVYPHPRKKSKARSWRLGSDGVNGWGRGVVEDPQMRGAVNMYKPPVADAPMAPPPGEDKAGGERKGRRAQFAMDAIEEAAPPEPLVDAAEADEDEEADFPASSWMSSLRTLTR